LRTTKRTLMMMLMSSSSYAGRPPHELIHAIIYMIRLQAGWVTAGIINNTINAVIHFT